DRTIRIWDILDGRHLRTIEGHQAAVTSVVFSPDGDTLFSGSIDGWIGIWNARTGAKIGSLGEASGRTEPETFYRGTGSRVVYWSGLAVSPDGQCLVRAITQHAESSVEVWDVASKVSRWRTTDIRRSEERRVGKECSARACTGLG